MIRAAVLAMGLAVAALLGATDGPASRAQNPKLVGTVGPAFSIILRDAQGSRVSTLAPGTYEMEVQDLAEEHNFHLTGPGVDRMTSVGGMGTENWTVTLTEGTYTYFCDPHSTTLRGRFTVGTPQPPTTTPAPAAITSKTKLVLTSGPSFSITLKTAAGKAFKAMKRGTYTVLVRDRAQIHNAHLIAPGYNRKTTVPFVGTQTWKVKLAKVGILTFQCDPHALSGMRGSRKIV